MFDANIREQANIEAIMMMSHIMVVSKAVRFRIFPMTWCHSVRNNGLNNSGGKISIQMWKKREIVIFNLCIILINLIPNDFFLFFHFATFG